MAKMIEVSAAPPGQQPSWVREQWVGEKLLTHGGKTTQYGVSGYQVLLAHAIVVVRPKSPHAAEWWEGWAFNQPHRTIFFPEKTCKPIFDEQHAQGHEHNGHGAEVPQPKSRRSRGPSHQY